MPLTLPQRAVTLWAVRRHSTCSKESADLLWSAEKACRKKSARNWNCTLRLKKSVGSPLLPPVKLITSNDRAIFKDNTSLGSKMQLLLYKQLENSTFTFLTIGNASRDANMLAVSITVQDNCSCMKPAMCQGVLQRLHTSLLILVHFRCWGFFLLR